jgi:hypothetical protein
MAAGSRRPMRLRIRARDGSGPGGGRGGGGGASRTSGRGSRTVTGGAAVALATGVVRDLSDPDGLLRPLLRSVATRLAASRRPGIGSVGERYLRLDPPSPAELAAPATSGAAPHPAGARPLGETAGGEGGGEDVVEAEVVEEDEDLSVPGSEVGQDPGAR